MPKKLADGEAFSLWLPGTIPGTGAQSVELLPTALAALMGSCAGPPCVNILLSRIIGLGPSRRAGFPVHLKNIGLTAVRRQKA